MNQVYQSVILLHLMATKLLIKKDHFFYKSFQEKNLNNNILQLK